MARPESYVDDDPALIAALTAAEAAHTEEDTDREAAIAAGLMPYQLAEFERTCCAIPDALRRNPGRLCTLRNHFLSRASKMANRFMPLAEATKGLDPVWRTSTEESEQAAAVYECLSHHGLINWGVIDDHPAMVAPGRAPPFPQCVPCPKPAPAPADGAAAPAPVAVAAAAAPPPLPAARCASSSSARARPGWRRRVSCNCSATRCA